MNKLTSALVLAVAAQWSPTSHASDRLLFQMTGPRDGSMADFSIAPGQSHGKAGNDFLVAPSGFVKIVSAVESAGSRNAPTGQPGFVVTEFDGSAPGATFFLTDSAVGRIVRQLISTYEAERTPVPKSASEIADSLR